MCALRIMNYEKNLSERSGDKNYERIANYEL